MNYNISNYTMALAALLAASVFYLWAFAYSYSKQRNNDPNKELKY